MHEAIAKLMQRLFPLPRSITGDGVRQTLAILREHIPLEVHEVPSGTPVFDWAVPKEWNIRGAHIKGPDGRVIVDFRDHNLHVMSYSAPVRRKMPLQELRPHLHSLPDQPEHTPYRTSYYHEDWGFCLPHKTLEALPEGEYEVVIDSSLHDGSLTYGELYLPGALQDEIIISSYICHPSLANDNLSGVALTAMLAKKLLAAPRRRHSYRFIFAPETIGALTWLSQNEKNIHRVKYGLAVTCVGGPGELTYKRSIAGDSFLDRAVEKVLAESGEPSSVLDFVPAGSDERHYSSPAFRIPMGSLMRTHHGKYREYHTSADDLEFATAESIAATLRLYEEIIEIFERDGRFLNLFPKGEPMLSRHGLYNKLGGITARSAPELARLWVLNQSDGEHSLFDIACRSKMKFADIAAAADELRAAKLLKIIN